MSNLDRKAKLALVADEMGPVVLGKYCQRPWMIGMCCQVPTSSYDFDPAVYRSDFYALQKWLVERVVCLNIECRPSLELPWGVYFKDHRDRTYDFWGTGADLPEALLSATADWVECIRADKEARDA